LSASRNGALLLILTWGFGHEPNQLRNKSGDDSMIKLGGTVAGILAAMGVVGLLSGCSGSSSESGMMITPGSAALAPGQTIQFQVVGTRKKVTWSVNGVAGGNPAVGTIDTNGNYTAPSANNGANLVITATTRSDLSSAAQVIVVPPGIVTATANPQVALYAISPPVDAMVTIAFGQTTNYGFTTGTQSTPVGGGVVGTFVAGMLANTTYHMQATVKFSNGVTFTDVDHAFTTTALPADELPSLAVTITPGMIPQSGVELLDLVVVGPATNRIGLAATDLNGSVLWSYVPGSSVPSTDVANPIKLLPNGHFLVNFSGAQADGSNSVLQEVDLSGQVIWQMTAAQLNQALAAATCTGCNITVVGTHHDFAVLPNGHLVVIAATQQVVSGTTVTGDVLIDLDQNHKPVWLWNEFDHLDINRRPYLYPDWTHTNAILYSADDGNLIISIRHQNWLVKIDYSNGTGAGDIIWHLGYQGDFTLQGGTDPTDWFWAQHGPSFVTTNSTGKFSLVLFDNGDDRVFASGITCGTTGQPPCLYSTVPILQLDESAKTATLVFNPTTQDYSFFGGNAEVLKNGNVEYDEAGATPPPASNAAILEVTQSSPPQTVWQMKITGQDAYRGFRMPSLYPGVQW
jgi:arylsulfate sulfotransferase